jgi:hypothetical protein
VENNLGELVLPEGWTEDFDEYEGEEVYTHTDGREQKDNPGKPEGIIAIANNAIPDMRALSIANVMGNNIGKEQLSKLQAIMRSKPNLVSLCGIANDATEANLSGLGMDADDTAILVSELPDKRALSLLNLASNRLCSIDNYGGIFDASGIRLLSLSHLAHTCLIAQVLPPLPMPSPIWRR